VTYQDKDTELTRLRAEVERLAAVEKYYESEVVAHKKTQTRAWDAESRAHDLEAKLAAAEKKSRCFVCEAEDSLHQPRFTQSHPIQCIDNWFRKQKEWDELTAKLQSTTAAVRKELEEWRARQACSLCKKHGPPTEHGGTHHFIKNGGESDQELFPCESAALTAALATLSRIVSNKQLEK
jgi:hypothetical protein